VKTFLKILAGLAVIVALGLGAVFYFTAGMSDAAEGFFRAVQANDAEEAKSHLSEGFRSGTSDAELRQFLESNSLTSFQDATWSSRKVGGGTGELEGTITTTRGGTIPLKLTFVKEGGAWKLHGITKPNAGVQSGVADADDEDEDEDEGADEGADDDAMADSAGDPAATPGVPGAAEQVALLQQTVRDFAVSAGAGNMEHFRATSSRIWQEQFPLEQFEQSFGSVYEAGFDFAAAGEMEPVIEAPAAALGAQGDLVVDGYFATDPRLVVQAKYVEEGGSWKPYAFKVDTQ
jgi:hypothetical protein